MKIVNIEEKFFLNLSFLFIVAFLESTIGYIPCTTLEDCVNVTGINVLCEEYECVCGENDTLIEDQKLCLPISSLGEHCKFKEQCLVKDAHTECTYSSNPEISHNICRCAIGYEKEYSSGREKCVRVYRTTVYEKNAKILHFFGNGDNVPIIMSCLAAFLALFACFAGIFQFLRRKQSSRTSLRSGDPQHPQEVVTLNGSTPTQPFPVSDISPSHIPNSVEFTTNPIISNSFIPMEPCQNIDFPPSYDEVINSTQVATIQEEDEEEEEEEEKKQDENIKEENRNMNQ